MEEINLGHYFLFFLVLNLCVLIYISFSYVIMGLTSKRKKKLLKRKDILHEQVIGIKKYQGERFSKTDIISCSIYLNQKQLVRLREIYTRLGYTKKDLKCLKSKSEKNKEDTILAITGQEQVLLSRLKKKHFGVVTSFLEDISSKSSHLSLEMVYNIFYFGDSISKKTVLDIMLRSEQQYTDLIEFYSSSPELNNYINFHRRITL